MRQVKQQENKPSCALHIPKDAQILGTALLHQQMWCWGYDIRHSQGNVLHHYGFTCRRPPEDVRGSSAYTLYRESGESILLWGFGLLYSRTGVGGLFLRRYDFTPCVTLSTDLFQNIWTPEQLPPLQLPLTFEEGQMAQSLLTFALLWISTYEQWVQEVYGTEYRKACLTQWKQTVVPAEKMGDEWKQLALASRFWTLSSYGQQIMEK